MRARIVDGRIATLSLECHVTDQCNLRCRQCCSLSPFLPPYTVEPDGLRRDLALACRVLAPGIFKIVGGEPLLHPRLLECMRIARESRIAPIISITTNGLLLRKMPELFWELLDAMTLSVYPQPHVSGNLMEYIQAKTSEHGISLNIKRQDMFQHMTIDSPRVDFGQTEAVFESCWLRDRCHMLRDGRFYLCTRPVHFDGFYRTQAFSETDGIALNDNPRLIEILLAYLESKSPLASCRLCMGGTGGLFPHRQLTRREVLARTEGPA